MAAAGLISSNWNSSGNAQSDDPHVVCDERLVSAAKSGDRGAFDELCRRHTRRIFHMTHRITRNREDAEDAVQECFLSAFIHLRSFDGRSRFSTWLTRIAMNAALMKVRKHRTCREVAIEEPVSASNLRPEGQMAEPSPNPEERYANNEREAILRDAIARLRPAIQEAVKIRLQGRSVTETAEILRISVPAAKGRLFHARAALRQKSQLQFVVPMIWPNSEASSKAARRV